jgi:biotin carboxylase
MGWKGHDTYENAVLMHHKDKFKQYCLEHDIPSPVSVAFTDIQAAKAALQTMEYPVIVKANDLTGGKGINRADNIEAAERALETAFQMSRDKHIVVEPFIEGTQHSICVFLMNKKVAVSSSCQSYSFKNPYLIQAETFPSREITGGIKRQLEQIIEAMAKDLNLADGILNLQLIIRDGRPYIIEMMRRCFGNEALLPYEMVTGFDWNEAYIKAALGLDCTDVIAKGAVKPYCGHFGIMPDREGILKSCIIDPQIERHLFKKRVMIENGGEITNHRSERVAYLYYEYDNIEEMNEDVRTFNDRIKIEIE